MSENNSFKKKIAKTLAGALVTLSYKLSGNRGLKQLFDFLCESAEQKGDYYMAYYWWPKKIANVQPIQSKQFSVEMPTHGIIITGLLKHEDDFTLNTVKFYQKLYPESKIIISTWKTQDSKIINELSKLDNVYVVLSDEPQGAESGVLHINNQLITATAGIKKAIELNCKYVLRTRTDVRIYRRDILQFLYCLVNNFPSVSSCQKQRIVTMSGRCGTMYKFYTLCDFLTYGTVEDMLSLYSIRRDNRGIEKVDTPYNELEWALNKNTPEIYLYKGYLDEKITDRDFHVNLQDYMEAVRDYFIILDEDFFQAYWFKYKYRFYWNRGREYIPEDENFDFLYWYILYNKGNKA